MKTHLVINPYITGHEFLKELVKGNRKNKLKLRLHNNITSVVDLCKAFKKSKHNFIIGVMDPVDCFVKAYGNAILSKHGEADKLFKSFCTELFPTADELGKALGSTDHDTKAIAVNVCNNLEALQLSRLTVVLGPEADFVKCKDRIVYVYTETTFADDLAEIRTMLNIPETLELPLPETVITTVSDEAKAGITTYLQEDYNVYNECLTLKEA